MIGKERERLLFYGADGETLILKLQAAGLRACILLRFRINESLYAYL